MIPIHRFKSNVVEASIVIVGVAIVSFMAGRYQATLRFAPFLRSAAAGDEGAALQERFGPSHHSEHDEEWIVRDFFNDSRDGVFVDVGANDYQRFSNTYYLETALGWSGIAIEPQTKFAADYAAHRPKTTFLPLFVSDTAGQDVVLHVPENDLVASGNQAFAESMSGHTTDLRAKTTTLDEVMASQHVTSVDFMSIDIELAEPAALKGFSIQRFRPRLVCIEAHPSVRQQILDYFASAGYVVVGKYLRADDANIWFMSRTPAAS